jgi:hypothetical protein
MAAGLGIDLHFDDHTLIYIRLCPVPWSGAPPRTQHCPGLLEHPIEGARRVNSAAKGEGASPTCRWEDVSGQKATCCSLASLGTDYRANSDTHIHRPGSHDARPFSHDKAILPYMLEWSRP